MIDILIWGGELAAFILFPLGQLGRISFYNQQVSLYPYELAMMVSLAAMLLKYRFKGLKEIKAGKAAILFFISLIVSYFLSIFSYSVYDNAVGFLYFVRLAFYFCHFFFLFYHVRKKPSYEHMLKKEIGWLIGAVVFTSWLQYLFYPNLRNLLYQGWDPHLYRVFSFFFEPYLAGGALGLFILFLYFRWHPDVKYRFAKWALIFMLFVLLMLTFSRTVYAAFLIVSILLLLQNRKPIMVAGLLALFIIVAILIPKPVGVGVQLFRTFSIETRYENAKEGIALWLEQPIFGVGYNRIRYKKAELGLASEFGLSHAAANYHSSFVTILAAGGVAGFLFYFMLLKQLAAISKPAFFYILFLAVISMGDNALLHPFMMFILFRMLVLEGRHSSLV